MELPYLTEDQVSQLFGWHFTGRGLFYGVTSLVLLYLVGSFFYDVYLNPLSSYPGPKLNAVSAIPYLYNTLRGDQVHFLQSLHERYGTVVRVAPAQLSYIDPQAWKDIYGHRIGGKKSNPKDSTWYTRQINGAPHLIAEFDDDEHGRVRKIFSNAFSQKALTEQEPLFRKYTDLLVSNIKQASTDEPDRKFDIVKLYNFTTFDIMSELTFGEPLGLLKQSKYSPWVDAIFVGFKATDITRTVKQYPVLGYILKLLQPKILIEKQKAHFQFSVDKVERRLKSPPQKPDIWALVLKDGVKLDRPRMHSNAAMFMLAGTETSATLLSGLTYHLLKNPDTLRKVTDEVRRSCPSEDDLTIGNLQKLEYLNACIEEGLRVYPPVAIGGPRRVPDEGATICGRWVPGRTRVYFSQYAAYHSPTNFRSPESFKPERWLGDPEFESDKKDALQPFSFGPRNCIGKNLAYHEIRLVFASMLQNFDMELCEESDGWNKQSSWSLWAKPPLMIKLRSVL